MLGGGREPGADVPLGVARGEEVGAERSQCGGHVVAESLQFTAEKAVVQHKAAVILSNAQSLAGAVGTGVEDAG